MDLASENVLRYTVLGSVSFERSLFELHVYTRVHDFLPSSHWFINFDPVHTPVSLARATLASCLFGSYFWETKHRDWLENLLISICILFVSFHTSNSPNESPSHRPSPQSLQPSTPHPILPFARGCGTVPSGPSLQTPP